jgi:uncharacterized protein YbjT (DUF2867 family)
VRVLVVGASGFIGSALVARLRSRGEEVVGVSRSQVNCQTDRVYALDIARVRHSSEWARPLQGVDAVVNCAGILQDGPRDSTEGVHTSGLRVLLDACERYGVRRFVHLSAVGVDRETPSAFSRSKLKGDEGLAARDLDWVILRPSVVIGRAAYGGSALIRALAALPIRPKFAAAGNLQPVHLDDLLHTVEFFLQSQAPTKKILEIVGPERKSLDNWIGLFREWFGQSPARLFDLPDYLARLFYWAGDGTRMLGWRAPIKLRRDPKSRQLTQGDCAWATLKNKSPAGAGLLRKSVLGWSDFRTSITVGTHGWSPKSGTSYGDEESGRIPSTVRRRGWDSNWGPTAQQNTRHFRAWVDSVPPEKSTEPWRIWRAREPQPRPLGR